MITIYPRYIEIVSCKLRILTFAKRYNDRVTALNSNVRSNVQWYTGLFDLPTFLFIIAENSW